MREQCSLYITLKINNSEHTDLLKILTEYIDKCCLCMTVVCTKLSPAEQHHKVGIVITAPVL